MTWASAYARQAKSDMEARQQLLLNVRLPACHQLHSLQMAAEKLCKAHLSSKGQPQDVLESSHKFIAGPLPLIVKQRLAKDAGKMPPQPWVLRAVRKLARQIELLHPQVDDGGTVPANCVYPWEDQKKQVHSPVDHDFSIDLLYQKAGITVLKAMIEAADELIEE